MSDVQQIMERAMALVADHNSLQEKHLAALEREKEKDKKICQLEKQVADLMDELNTTNSQLLDTQKNFYDIVQSAEKNSKAIKKVEFDGRGVQRTAGV